MKIQIEVFGEDDPKDGTYIYWAVASAHLHAIAQRSSSKSWEGALGRLIVDLRASLEEIGVLRGREMMGDGGDGSSYPPLPEDFMTDEERRQIELNRKAWIEKEEKRKKAMSKVLDKVERRRIG